MLVDVSTEHPSLRELKKRRTREEISRHATRLFLRRGFDDVTIAEIAAAAGVSKMTVTNYFPRKEDLALDLGEVFVRIPADAVRERRRGESALAALRRAYLRKVAERDPVIGFSGPEFARMVTASSTLLTRLRQFHDDRETLLAKTLAEETGVPASDLTPRVAATVFGAVHRLLFEETLRLTLRELGDDAIAERITRDTETAFAALEPSFGDYAVRA